MIASFLESGSVSWLYYSDRLVEFPLGIFGIALATVILPSLSKNHAAEDTDTFSRSLDWGLRLVLLIGLPASIGLLMLAEPMISTLFQYDQFSYADVVMTGKSLKAYSIGLLGFILVKVLVPGFTSRKEMKTPVRFGIYAMCANMVMNIAFVFPLAHAGLALATSIGAFINASLLLRKLLQDNVYSPLNGWRIFILRVVLANSAMAAIIFHFVETSWWNNWAIMERVLYLSMWICIAALIYFIVLVISGFRLQQISGK
jgi:putative peptidoglycan lipid II flippase